MNEFSNILMKENRAFMDFSSKDEYVEAMVEDLSDWLNFLYRLQGNDELTLNNFFEQLKDGVILCKHAHMVQSFAEAYVNSYKCRQVPMKIGNKTLKVPLQPPSFIDFSKIMAPFLMRDNVSNFISWCRNWNIPPSLTFETDDLVLLKNPRNVVIALLEMSRIGKLFGMEVPDIIQLEQEIDDEINEANNVDVGIVLRIENSDASDSTAEMINTNRRSNKPENIHIEDNIDGVETEKCIQVNNSSLEIPDIKISSGNNISFGFNGRRSSVNITRNDISPLFDKSKHLDLPIDHSTDTEALDVCDSPKAIRKSQSIYFNTDGSPDIIIADNSDNDSNFSQTSTPKFKIPKYETQRPVGRVKIYDHFNKTNYVAVKKTREKVDLRSLDEMVREIVSQCKCNEQFPMKKISEGQYQIGDKKSLIFVRILRTHVMVRVGGGWNTLNDFLNKFDTCRKDKCENFKFRLPSVNKKSPSTTIAPELELTPNASSSSKPYGFRQGMMSVNIGSKENCFHSNQQIEIRIVNEENNENESIIEEKMEIKSLTETNIRIQTEETVTANNNENNKELPKKFKSVSSKDNAVKLRARQVTDQNRKQCLSLNSCQTLPNRFVKTGKEKTNDSGHGRPKSAIKDSGSSTKIPIFKSQTKK